MGHLSEEFWSERYKTDQTGWDLGTVSTPIKEYVDQLTNKDLKILIPGCGMGYEAEYLHEQGFTNVHIIDLSIEPLNAFKERVKDFPTEHIHKGDFFAHEGKYDLILEQTMFCAIDPALRSNYAEAVNKLLNPLGKLVGVLFDFPLESGPPYGGSKEEYLEHFQAHFDEVSIERCYNSIPPRADREFFIKLCKVSHPSKLTL